MFSSLELFLLGTIIIAVITAITYYKAQVLRYFRTDDVPNVKTTSNDETTITTIPPSHPELGNLPDVAAHGSLHEYLMHLHLKHGDVVGFWFNRTRVISIGSAAHFKCTSKLVNRPKLFFASYEPMIGANSIQYANNDDWKNRKKSYVTPAFSHDSLTAMINAFSFVIKRTIDQWEKQRGSSTSVVVPVHETMLLVALQSICMTSMGSMYRDLEKCRQFKNCYDTVTREIDHRIGGSIPASDSEREHAFNAALDEMHVTATGIAKERRAKGVSEHTFIDYLLTFTDDDALIGSDIITFLVGGFHTTGNALTWMLYYLSLYPQIQEKVRTEINTIFSEQSGSHAAVGNIPELSISLLNKLTYTHQVMDETIRHSILGPFAARYSDEPVVLANGYIVPAKTPIIQALGFAMHDPNVWKNPHIFDPERFSHENIRTRPPLQFSPFGISGGRLCPGNRYSYTEMAIVISAMLPMYQVQLKDPSQKVEAAFGLVSHPKQEINIELIRI